MDKRKGKGCSAIVERSLPCQPSKTKIGAKYWSGPCRYLTPKYKANAETLVVANRNRKDRANGASHTLFVAFGVDSNRQPFVIRTLMLRGGFRLTAKLSGSGGTGETRLNDWAIFGKPRSVKKRRSRCPLQLMLGAIFCFI